MKELLEWYDKNSATILHISFLLFIALPLVYLITSLIKKSLKKHLSAQSVMLLGKFICYGGTTVIFITILRELGFNLTTLLGAAGIAAAAIGFASQTSLSNIISGFFLIWEKPFQIGDLIQVDTSKGIVHSMDLLSVYLKTFDNQLIRIPNESLIKASFTNITRFPIRRMDINIGAAYKEDVEKVLDVLKDVADNNPYCLDEPEPVIIFKGFGDSALEFLFGPWFVNADYIHLRNTILRDIKKRFDQEGIEIPFPHRTLYVGAATEPFPIEIINHSNPSNSASEKTEDIQVHIQ